MAMVNKECHRMQTFPAELWQYMGESHDTQNADKRKSYTCNVLGGLIAAYHWNCLMCLCLGFKQLIPYLLDLLLGVRYLLAY